MLSTETRWKPSSWERHPSIQVCFYNFSHLKNPAHAIHKRCVCDRPKKCANYIFYWFKFLVKCQIILIKIRETYVLCKYLVNTKLVIYTALGTCFDLARKSDTCNYVRDDVFSSLKRTYRCLFPLIHWIIPVDSVSCSCNEVCPMFYNIYSE